MSSSKTARMHLAGAPGFSEIGRAGQANLVRLPADAGHEVLDPFTLASQDEVLRISGLASLDEQRVGRRALNLRIGETNRQAIGSCDALLAVLDLQDVDSVMAAEIGYAYAVGKRVVGLSRRFSTRCR